jgi:hypothetical protein
MSTENVAATGAGIEPGVVAKLSTLDRFVPVWIITPVLPAYRTGLIIMGLAGVWPW